ncbi:MAG: DUF512 domain-containing protein [Clostridia bacterium]|nr:DUF512 domain-containing protein [Clostridia bacterium]
MSVKIAKVNKHAPAYKAGIRAGALLHRINGNDINDRLDYDFYSSEEDPVFEYEQNGELLEAVLEKDEYEDAGLEFETYLIDCQQHCKNKCVFCFIEQNPAGMRDAIYFKDDDSRMSFLAGNYITMTAVDDAELERMIRYKLNVNISVHTTEPELRVEMMKNPAAAKINDQLKRLAEGGVKMNCQIVLCPGINDGAHLERTVRDLAALYPAVQSVAVVPVGLTEHRDGLTPLRLNTPEESAAVIDFAESFGREFVKEHGTSFVFAADEFYIGAGRAIPPAEYYEDYPQYENGVGMLASLLDESEALINSLSTGGKKATVNVITGFAAAPYLRRVIEELREKCPRLECEVHAVRNDFFGSSVTVAGLVTGTDICGQLEKLKLKGYVFIPDTMLRYENDMFLDSMTLKEVSKRLGVKLRPVPAAGAALVREIAEVCGCGRIR